MEHEIHNLIRKSKMSTGPLHFESGCVLFFPRGKLCYNSLTMYPPRIKLAESQFMVVKHSGQSSISILLYFPLRMCRCIASRT